MNVARSSVRKAIAAGLMVFLAAPLAHACDAVPLPTSASTQKQDATPAPGKADVSDDSDVLPNAPAPNPQQAQEPAQSGSGKPVGTAAAPEEKTSGITASRPAGAVIAPARQKRARAILIRVSAVVASAVAIGCVVGLSKASSSKP
jgi:hypothetical protein